MPILAEEPSLYPEYLLAGMNGDSLDRHWWVACVKPRQEKAFARDLLQREIPFYLPIIRKTLVYRGREIRSGVPLFSGYVFVFGSEDERVTGMTTNRVCKTLFVADPDRLQADLRQLQEMIVADVPLTVESRLATGRRVRVRRGLLEGFEGTVVERRGRMRLVVHVDFLQQGASVEIEDFMLEPTD